MSLQAEKKAVRKELAAATAAFSDDYVEEVSRAVCRQILESRLFLQSQTVFGYLSFEKEISVDAVLREALRLGKTVLVPRILSRTEMQAAVLHTLEDLPLDRYGIRTVPEPPELAAPDGPDLILVPGAGFTEDGCRMGRGAGYYDRFLARAHGFTLGITCEKLLWSRLPCEPHDRKVEGLVTENRIIRCLLRQ